MNPVLKVLTPARLTAAVGVATGLGAAVTAVLSLFPTNPTLQMLGGILVIGSSVFKFLDGQSNFEVAQLQAQNAALLQAQDHAHNLAVFGPATQPEQPEPEAATAELPGDQPIVETPEPDRLAAQAQTDAPA